MRHFFRVFEQKRGKINEKWVKISTFCFLRFLQKGNFSRPLNFLLKELRSNF